MVRMETRSRRNRKAAIKTARTTQKQLTIDQSSHPLSDVRPFSQAGLGLPSKKFVRLRYCDQRTITSTLGGLSKYLFAANGLYDPDITGAGHQPYGFDQWMTFYKYATVRKSRIVLETCSEQFPQIIGVTFALTDPTATISDSVGLTETNRGVAVLTNAYRLRAIETNFDLKLAAPDHDPADVRSSAAANPTTTMIYCVYMQTADLTTTSRCFLFTSIEYEVELEQPLTVVTS